jgi:hypothetical protein
LEWSFAATGVGSVPNLEVDPTCRLILELFPELPFWPQFVNLSPEEDMVLQFSEGLPGLCPREGGGTLQVSSDSLEDELTRFYEAFLNEDVEAFAVSRERARGLYALLEIIGEEPEAGGGLIKGQSVGPITFASSVTLKDGRQLLHDEDLLDAAVKGLSIKLLWQARALGRTGRRPVLFIDEPALSGIGSAFSAMNRDRVVEALREMMGYCRERSNAILGIHCCANTDWSMVLAAEPDILNFDAYGYLDPFLLYPDEVVRFVEGGGTIAWGIVPTTDFQPGLTADHLQSRLEQGLDRLADQGLSRELLRNRAMITSACGMGGMEIDDAETVLRLISELARRMR